MAFSWGEIVDEIRDHLNSKSDVFYTDAEILVKYNHSELFFARETKYLITEITISVSSDGVSFGVPNDFLGVLAIAIIDSEDRLIHLRPLGMAGRERNSLMDVGYFEKERGLFNLTTQRDIDTTTDDPIQLKFIYYGKPKPFVSTTDRDRLSEVPDEYIPTVIAGTLMELYMKRRQLEEFKFAKQIFEEHLARSIKAEGRRMGTKKITIGR